MTTSAPSDLLDLDDIQGFILRSYPLPCVRYVYLRVSDTGKAQRTLREMAGQITDSNVWRSVTFAADSTLNLAFTFQGLLALGLPASSLITFPAAFADGMERRALLLGDEGESAPEHWDKIWLHRQVHVWLAIFAASETVRDDRHRQLLHVLEQDSGLQVLGGENAGKLKDPVTHEYTKKEHFGYVDGISDTEFAGMPFPSLPGNGKLTPDGSWAPLATGEFLLGYPDESPEWPPAPMPHNLARNGTFMALRKLHQKVASFRKYLDEQSKTFPGGKELLAAKFVGRWRDGTPLTLSPGKMDAELAADSARNNAFDFSNDMDGHRCPMGAHIRRTNPRNALLFNKLADRRRIIRRGQPYGEYIPEDQAADDNGEHGIMFIALNASLERQFEFVQQQWIHYGNDFFQGDDRDPLVGNHAGSGKMVIQGGKEGDTERPPHICAALPTFVTTRGGDYFFIPSLTALRLIASGLVNTL